MTDLLKIKVEYIIKSKSNYAQYIIDELLIEMIDTCTVALETPIEFQNSYTINARETLSVYLPSFVYGDYCSKANFDTVFEYDDWDPTSSDFSAPVSASVLGATIDGDVLNFDLTGYSESSPIQLGTFKFDIAKTYQRDANV